MNAGLILAGGRSERLTGYDKPKQFIEIDGKLVISYCLKVFEQCSDIDLICVVAAEEWRGDLGNILFAAPGKSRQHSVYNGLLALKQYAPDWVVIHDAARPLVTGDDIRCVITSSLTCDGATPALPVTDTMYQSIDGKTITKTLDRDKIFAGQTPECYDFKKYLAIHEQLSDEELSSIRGSSEIAVNFGMEIALAKGNMHNFKITTNVDLDRFKSILEDK